MRQTAAVQPGGATMRIETNQISRDWTIQHEGRVFYVNFTESDGQTLALMNRDNWEVQEDTEDGVEELDIYGFSSDSPDKKKQIEENYKLMKKLILFCMQHWDNDFTRELSRDIKEQTESLSSL